VRRSFEELSCCNTVDGALRQGQRSRLWALGHWHSIGNKGPAERIQIDCVLDKSAKGDFKLPAEVPENSDT
jgi:hypothetical protein